jgi:phage-related protein (TIGR01555 family)
MKTKNRFDGLVNFFTGYGTPRDKNFHDRIYPGKKLGLSEIDNFYETDFFVQNYINLIVEESLRKKVEIELGYISSSQKLKLQPIFTKELERLKEEIEQNKLKDIQKQLLEKEKAKVGKEYSELLSKLSFSSVLSSAMIRWLCEDKFEDDSEESGSKVSFFEVLKEALIESRLYGGSLIIMGINDGNPPHKPVNEGTIKSIDWIQCLDRYCVSPYHEQGYITSSNPQTYQIHSPHLSELQNKDAIVHCSRIIRINGGAQLTRRQRLKNNGWFNSKLQATYKEILRFQKAAEILGALLYDSQTIHHGIEGLFEMLNDGDSESSFNSLADRLTRSDIARSFTRREIYDLQREKIEIVNRDFTSLIEAVKMCLDIAVAAVRLPHTFLLGKSPTGTLSSSGESENRDMERSISEFQFSYVEKPVKRFLKLLQLAKEGPTMGELLPELSFSFPSPFPLTRKEEVELIATQAGSDSAYINSGVVTPEEVAIARFGGEKPQSIVLDWEAREKAKQQVEQGDRPNSANDELLGFY